MQGLALNAIILPEISWRLSKTVERSRRLSSLAGGAESRVWGLPLPLSTHHGTVIEWTRSCLKNCSNRAQNSASAKSNSVKFLGSFS
jgi:hypothetical protein